MGYIFYQMGQFFRSQDQLDSSYITFSTAYDLFKRKEVWHLAGKSIYQAGVDQYFARDYYEAEKSIVLSIDALKNSDKRERFVDLYSCYNVLGSIAASLKEYDRSIENRQQALEYMNELEDPGLRYYSIMNNMGTAKYEQGEYLESLEYYNRVLDDTLIRSEDPRLYARALLNRGRSNFALRNFSAVEEDYQEALQLRLSDKDEFSLPRSYYFLAEYLLAQRDSALARENILQARQWAETKNETDGLLDILKLQAQIEPEKAPILVDTYFNLFDSLINEERLNRDKFARIRFETDEYIEENRFLARQRMMWIWIAMGLLLLAASVFIIISQRVRNQKLKFQQQQQEANEEIFNLMLQQNEKLEEGKQEEQKRISEELHDGVLGQMNGVRMVLLGLNGKTDEAALAMRGEAIEKLKEIQEEIRGISHELSDAAYQKFHNFILSIEDLVRSTGDAVGLKHELDYDPDIDWDSLRGEIKINLYRIIQECLQNTIKHAEAGKVSVLMELSGNLLQVAIEDDGKGFQKRRGKRGIGQKNIDSRVRKIGGTWEVISAPGAGTRVLVRVPYMEPNQEPVADMIQESV